MIYVIAQFVLLMVIVWPANTLQFSWFGLLLFAISTVIGIFTLITNRPGNFNIRPHPKETGELIVDGPYQFIRHPMYSVLLIGALGVLFWQFSLYKLISWVLLAIILILKSRKEEAALCIHYKQYQRYREKTNAFIPWIW